MIDGQELQAMRQRYKTAQKAAEAVYVHANDGLFGELPPEEAPPLLTSAVASVRDVPALLAEVQRLSPASYLTGPEDCVEGGCSSEEPPEGEWCSHVQEKVATFGHVKQADTLDRLVRSLRDRLLVTAHPSIFRLLELIEDTYEQMEADEDIAPVISAPLVSGGTAGSPQESGPDHGGDR